MRRNKYILELFIYKYIKEMENEKQITIIINIEIINKNLKR